MKNYELTEGIGLKLAIARNQVNISQKKLAKKMGVSTKTIQNWESGYSTPSLNEVLELFKALGLNPLPYLQSLLYPGLFNKVSSERSPKEVDKMLEQAIKDLSENEKRGLLFLLRGDHGSSTYCVIQLIVAYLHLQLVYRQMIATSINNAYNINKDADKLICNDNIMPDSDALSKAINQASISVLNGQYGYVAV